MRIGTKKLEIFIRKFPTAPKSPPSFCFHLFNLWYKNIQITVESDAMPHVRYMRIELHLIYKCLRSVSIGVTAYQNKWIFLRGRWWQSKNHIRSEICIRRVYIESDDKKPHDIVKTHENWLFQLLFRIILIDFNQCSSCFFLCLLCIFIQDSRQKNL